MTNAAQITPALTPAQLAGVVHTWQAAQLTRWLPVAGDSMWPQLRHGDEVCIRFGQHRIRPGDVALLWDDSRLEMHLLLHRIIHVDAAAGAVVTQGDNRRQPDPPHPINAVHGVVVARRRGRRVQSWETRSGRVRAQMTAAAVRWSILPATSRLLRGVRRRAHQLTTQSEEVPSS